MSHLVEGLSERTAGYLREVAEVERLTAAATREAVLRNGPGDTPGAPPGPLAPVRALVRAGGAIARYALRAALRPRANDANIQFAQALLPLWSEVRDDPDSTLARAIITVQAFARTAETQAMPGGHAALLADISAAVRDAAFTTPWYPHLLEGDRWGDVLGYQAPYAASRATTVWRALTDLADALPQGLVLPPQAPPVPTTPLLPFPTTARLTRVEVGIDAMWADAAPPPPPAPEGDQAVEVWFGTARALRTGTRAEFGPERSDHLRLGRCFVHVPAAHRRGSVGSAWWQKLLRFDFRDDTLKLQNTEVLDDGFGPALRARLGDTDEPRALLYIHGYNTSFEDAAIRTAQLAVDLPVDGIAAFFSWPSWASAVDYVADIAQAEYSWEMLTEFVQTLKDAGIQRLDVVVHSMGNRVLSWAIERLAGAAPFTSLYLAAADLDPDILRQRQPLYQRAAREITLYVSKFDKALGLSRFLHLVGRVGLAPPPTIVPGAWTVDASHVDDSFLGHGYYADEPRVLADLAAALRGVTPDRRRETLVQVGSPATHWELTRG